MTNSFSTPNLIRAAVFEILRVELGLVAGSTVALVVFSYAFRARMSAGAIPDAESMIDGVLDYPLEG